MCWGLSGVFQDSLWIWMCRKSVVIFAIGIVLTSLLEDVNLVLGFTWWGRSVFFKFTFISSDARLNEFLYVWEEGSNAKVGEVMGLVCKVRTNS